MKKNNSSKQNKNRGQSLIELVFIIGLIILGVTGVIVLIVNSMGARTRGYDRKTAVQIAETKMEGLVSLKKNSPDNFWNLAGVAETDAEGFSGYRYSIGFTNIYGDSNYPNCGVGVTDCAEATVTVKWDGKDPQNPLTITSSRFFSRNE